MEDKFYVASTSIYMHHTRKTKHIIIVQKSILMPEYKKGGLTRGQSGVSVVFI